MEVREKCANKCINMNLDAVFRLKVSGRTLSL